MFYRVNEEVVALHAQPDDAAPHPGGTVVRGNRVEKLSEVSSTDWVKIRLVDAPPERSGFVHLATLVTDVPDPKVDHVRFTAAVCLAAREFESNPFYLYALAFTLSKVTNTSDTEPGAVGFGPFRFTPECWSKLVTAYGVRTGATLDDRDDPFLQASLAAADENESATQLQAVLGRIPQANELYLAFILGESAGKAIANPMAEASPVDQVLTTATNGATAKALLTRYAAILQPDGHPGTSSQALAAAAIALQPGLDQAAKCSAALDPPYNDKETSGPTAVDRASFEPAPSPKMFADLREVARKTFGTLLAAGWSKEQACGLIANIQAESGFKVDKPGDNGLAYGICQWHPDRQSAFERQYGRPIRGTSLEDQLAFVTFEMTLGDETAAGKMLKAQTDPTLAGWVVARYYERPAHSSEWSKRAGVAESFLILLTSDGGNVLQWFSLRLNVMRRLWSKILISAFNYDTRP